MHVSFRDGYQLDSIRMAVIFFADVDGQRVTCLISVEALQDYFGGAKSQDIEAIFRNNRARIEALAAAKIRSEQVSPNGDVLIRSTDLIS